MTFPVESISGTMIAQTNTPAQINPKRGGIMWKGSVVRGLPGQVHPVALQESVMDLAGTVERELPERVDEAFDAFAHPLSKLGDRLWNDTLWSS